jgi:hypothetical protein
VLTFFLVLSLSDLQNKTLQIPLKLNSSHSFLSSAKVINTLKLVCSIPINLKLPLSYLHAFIKTACFILLVLYCTKGKFFFSILHFMLVNAYLVYLLYNTALYASSTLSVTLLMDSFLFSSSFPDLLCYLSVSPCFSAIPVPLLCFSVLFLSFALLSIVSPLLIYNKHTCACLLVNLQNWDCIHHIMFNFCIHKWPTVLSFFFKKL